MLVEVSVSESVTVDTADESGGDSFVARERVRMLALQAGVVFWGRVKRVDDVEWRGVDEDGDGGERVGAGWVEVEMDSAWAVRAGVNSRGR